ncbi:MAG: metallophosphatase family protein [Prevotellaceae bacterium]|jgi:putative phosphoesterase|nr:metallophosphatase family protein [Prevotellaceae bacterium]
MKIGVISDTHGFFDYKLRRFLENVDEIWHAGDIGSLKIADEIALFKPLYAVHGNIDDMETRSAYPKVLELQRENLNIIISHITGYPGKYSTNAEDFLRKHPKILVGGHSHILKILYDKKNKLLFMNPGAAGISGFHRVRTALRFKIEADEIKEMEIGEWDK